MTEKNRVDGQAVVNGTREIFRGRRFSFLSQDVTLPNGIDSRVDFIRHPGSVAIVPMLENQTLVMITQYRHPVGGYLLEIPAGTLEPDESPVDCARRELEEETGMAAEEFVHLGNIHILPSYSDERIHLYLARKITATQQRLDPDEIIRVGAYPLDRVMRMISDGRITCALTILSVQAAVRYLEQGDQAVLKRPD